MSSLGVDFPYARLVETLRDEGFVVVEGPPDPVYFGNRIVTAEREAVGIRFVKDRGQWFAELRASGQWFDVARWSALADPTVAPLDWRDTAGVERFIVRGLPWILDAVAHHADSTRRRLEERA
jgi:hypothetical protein